MLVSRIAATLILAFTSIGNLQAATEQPTIKLGIARCSDAAKWDVEFQQYEWMQPVFRKEQIEASLMPREPLYRSGMGREQIDALLRGYHAIHLITTEEGIPHLTPELKTHARMVGEALADYVKQGGGLFLEVSPVRYPGTQDEAYWNLVLEPLGLQILHEAVFDPTRIFEDVVLYGHKPEIFWFTRNFLDSNFPLLQGVRGLCLPRASSHSTPGVAAMEYSDAWNVVVRGEKEAKSYLTPANNQAQTDEAGTYTAEPPIVATRTLGKGRIVSYPLAEAFSGMNHGNPMWPDIVESKGNPKKEWPSDSMRLQLNAYRWLGVPALENTVLGTHQIPPASPVRYAKSVSWDNEPFRSMDTKEEAKGIIGARSSFSGGKGTVDEYVKAAKEAGLKFIVFSDPLEKLTEETWNALKKACAEASAAGDFYACPGIQFTDAAGIRWALWGESIVYPPKTFTLQHTNKTYPLWDGERILARGYYIELTGLPGGGILSYKDLRSNKSHPENLWWFWHYFPRVYENNKLVEDQHGEFLFGLRDMRVASIVSYTGIDSPEKVKAASQYFTSFPDMDSARKALNSWAGKNIYGHPWQPNFYVSEGPRIVKWSAVNPQLEENWRHTKGAQRVRLMLDVQSDAGISDIKVHDADRGVVRRFAGNGGKEIVREFEMVHDRTRYLTLEVTDVRGRKAFSQFLWIFSYKQSLFRCGDNLNILGPLGMQWHADRNEFFDAAKNFRNGADFEILGYDTSRSLVPMPSAWLQDTVSIRGVGTWPTQDNAPGMTSKIMYVELSSPNMQIATMELKNLAERFETDVRPPPALGSSPKDVSENEYFRRTHRLISPEDRVDWYTAWNHRRGREGRKDYRGSFNWHEGEIEFKKDVVLEGAVPIPLIRMTCPYDPEKGWGTLFLAASGSDDDIKEVKLPAEKPEVLEGSIRAGGFVSQLPSLVGYQAFLAGPDTEYVYHARLPGNIVIGLGHDGQEVKAGTVFKYRFAVGVFTNTEQNAKLLQHTVKAMNLAGGSDGYPLKVKTGKLKDAAFILNLEAEGNEASFSAGPQKLIIDLPIMVKGIKDNGCVAVYSTKRPWFRFVSVVGDTAYFQEPIDEENTIWAGNIFTADNKEIKLTAVIDGQNRNRKPFLEVHNPTGQAVKTTIRSPKHTPEFGDMKTEVSVPAGTSIRLNIEDGKLAPPKQEG